MVRSDNKVTGDFAVSAARESPAGPPEPGAHGTSCRRIPLRSLDGSRSPCRGDPSRDSTSYCDDAITTITEGGVVTLGPVELVVVGFPGSRFSGEIRPRIQDLVDRNIVNIVDALLITKSDQGEVTYFEMDEIQDVDPDLRALHACFSEELDLISEEDGEVFAAELAPGSSALAIAFEHTWMRPVRDAVVNSGGVLIADVQIPAQVVDEVLDAVGHVQSPSNG